MNTRTTIGRLARLLALVGLLWLAVPSAQAGDGLRLARDGRLTTYAAAGIPALGGVMALTGIPLRRYDLSNVAWYDKAEYDRRYQQRLVAADVLQFTGLGLGASHLPLLATGVMMEAHGLRRFTRGRHPITFGWVGTGLILGAGSAFPVAFAGPFGGGTIAGVAIAGYVLLWVQHGQNVATVRHLPPTDQERFRKGDRRRVQAVAAPWFLGDGGGALVALTF